MARLFLIDNEPVLVNRLWGISDKINSRTTLNITVVNLLNLTGIDNGDTVEVFDGATKIFSGVALNVSKREPSPDILEYSVQAVDNSALADKRLIAKVYEYTLAGVIVKDLITQKLAAEGVTQGTIQDGPVIKKAVFNYIKCSDALNYLKGITGFAWTIDKDRQLNFYNQRTNKSPFTLSNSVQHSGFVQSQSMDRYCNTQYVRGGKGKTGTQTNESPTPKPDGSSKNFVLRYPIAEKPVIEVNINGAGWMAISPSDIGINGIDNNKKWYFTYNSNTISQDFAEIVLKNDENGIRTADTIRITYKGLRNLFVIIDDPSQINKRAQAETGTSGIYENLAKEDSINESAQAIQFAQGLIETYGQIKDNITFNTNVTGLEAGQLLPVQKPLYDINEDFLIEAITIRADGPSQISYSVKALDGASVGGWEEFFKDLIKGQRDFVIAENEVIILLQNQIELQGYKGQTQIKIYNASYPSDDSFPGDDQFPNGLVAKEVILND